MKLASLLGHAAELLQQVRSSERPADSIIDIFFRSHKYLGSHDRRFIAEATYGTLRHLRKCEHLLLNALGSHTEGIIPEDGFLLLLTTYLIALDDRRTKVTVEDLQPILKSVKLKSHLAGILEAMDPSQMLPEGDAAEPIALKYSFPDWMIERFIKQYGETETEALCRSLNEQAPVTLRVNELKSSVETCQKALKAEGIDTLTTDLSPIGLHLTKRTNVFQLQAFRDGLFEVQDEGSQLLPLLIDPKPTAKVLDACAGAGGKTLELAALMKNRGEVMATDVHGSRLEELRKRTRRAGVSNVRIQQVEDIGDLAGKHAAHFDLVLVDAPCSGIGTLRRNPGMKWMVTEETVKEVSEKQFHILSSSASLVREGGMLAYATCTLFREENEEVVERFLQSHPEFSLPASPPRSMRFDATKHFDGKYVRFFPHREGTDGFFVAVLKKQGIRSVQPTGT
jgi:16S rRNA (cytosine967-C5)-methyltransferase